MTLEEIQNLKKKSEEINKLYERNKGQIEQLLQQLKDYGCETLEDAEQKLNDLKQKGEKLNSVLEKLGSEIEEEWDRYEKISLG